MSCCRITRPPPARPRWLPSLWLLGVCAACAAWAPQARAGLLEDLMKARNKIQQQKEQAASAAGPGLAERGASNPREAAMLALFEKRNVTGNDLVEELGTIRTLMRSRRAATAAWELPGEAERELRPVLPTAAAEPSPKDLLTRAAMEKIEHTLKPFVASVGFSSLEEHMATLIADPQRLSGESISLPSAKGLSARQMRRVIRLAAIVVATRITGQVLKKAQEDFADIETDFQRQIERREKAASLLYGVLFNAGSTTEPLNGVYADADLKFLRDTVSRMSVQEFSNDMGAQNLALRYLQSADPAAYGEYKTASDGTLKRTRGYLQTTAGVAAFGALLVTFTRQTLDALRENKSGELWTILPFVYLFMKEVPPVVKAAWGAGAAGIVEVPMKANKRFRIVTDAGSTVDVGHAADVFAEIKKQADAEPLLTEAFFRRSGDGLLYKLYRCDRAETGRLLDAAVPLEQRDKFAAEYLAREAQSYSFANTFAEPGDNVREKELGDELLREDQRRQATRRELGQVQRWVSEGYGRWGDEQLMRLIFANREGQAAQSTLQLGELRVRPIPTAQSVFAYESLVDGCGKQFDVRPPTPTTQKPGTRPATRPAGAGGKTS